MSAKLIPNLWFNANGMEAAEFWCRDFGGRILSTMDYPENAPGPAGTLLTVEFEIFGQRITDRVTPSNAITL